MQRVRKRILKKWMQRHPIIARITAFILLVLSPVLCAAMILWEERTEFAAVTHHLFAAALLPWEDK